MIEDEFLIGQRSNDESIFTEDVIIEDLDNWAPENFIDNMPKIIDNSYLKLFWTNNKWYTCYNDKVLESDIFLEESIKKMYLRLKENKK